MIDDRAEPIVPTPHAVLDAVSRVAATVAIAQGLAVSGRSVDLAGLEMAAGVMCAKVLDLPPREGVAMRPALAELDRKLSSLAQTLASQTR